MFDLLQFTYDKKNRCIITDASDLNLKGWPKEFQVKSHHTGKITNFVFDHFDYYGPEDEREIGGARYSCATPSININSALIIND